MPATSPPRPPPAHQLTQAAGTSDWVARVLMAAAGLGAIHTVEPGRARQVTATREAQVQGGPQRPSAMPPALAPAAG